MIAALLLALLAATAQPQPFLRAHQDALLDFRYGWPAIVGEEPALRAILAREMETAEAQARATAQEDRDARGGGGFPFHRHSYSKLWRVAGRTPRLISLTAENEAYTGGARGSFAFAAVLWDRAADRRLDAAILLDGPALDRMRPRFCARLDAMRSERRGAPVVGDIDSFTACPPLGNLILAPADGDGGGRFDTIAVLIPPYEAGPWVEGSYVVELPLAREDIEDLPALYRADFEPAAAAPEPSRSGERG